MKEIVEEEAIRIEVDQGFIYRIEKTMVIYCSTLKLKRSEEMDLQVMMNVIVVESLYQIQNLGGYPYALNGYVAEMENLNYYFRRE